MAEMEVNPYCIALDVITRVGFQTGSHSICWTGTGGAQSPDPTPFKAPRLPKGDHGAVLTG